MATFSISPDGEKFPLPTESEYAAEFQRLEKIVADQRKQGREIVVVVGYNKERIMSHFEDGKIFVRPR